MTFSILEAFTIGKSECGYSEDRLVQTANHFGVLDGSRGPDGLPKEVITSILDSAKDHIKGMSADTPLPELVGALSDITADRKGAAGFSDFKRSGGFVFCLYSTHYREIWRVGDCKFKNEGFEPAAAFQAEIICADARSMILKAKLLAGATADSLMADPGYSHVIDDLLVHETAFLNAADHPLGIGAITGSTVPDVFVKRFPARPGSLIITSDGYPDICEDLGTTEARLEEVLKMDPLCIDENRQCKGLAPGLLSFDDRSFISAMLSA
ncbi:hypothetical protein E1180_10820 [Roseibium denhamense]|uniref:PPM-type phosphatase domain-containing protein n=1 Tax=Roseibium denhamense TaxID=76305 RepID=A0ABY1N797_9HYPH|nr:hypothetical protein [Roseibium denhamense]MTI06004.1 hypothetical protein [Roseibium denhamense]SMP02100.1 hypothetical protein SAMN06265374_0431 [Roseibium denhamense]